MIAYVVVFLVSCGLALALTPLSVRLSRRFGLQQVCLPGQACRLEFFAVADEPCTIEYHHQGADKVQHRGVDWRQVRGSGSGNA